MKIKESIKSAVIKQKYFITGVSGSIGTELYKKLTIEGHVTGCSRNKPLWWNDKDEFIKIDFLKDDIGICLKEISRDTIIIHLLNLAHQEVEFNKIISLKLLDFAKIKNIKKIIYISSIRVYGANYGVVDEDTLPVPSNNDLYGKSKHDVEKALINSDLGNTQLIICRIGSVFSLKTKNKIPIQLRSLGRALNLGISTHLISAYNVVCALEFLVENNFQYKKNIYNITQEYNCENNYLLLGDSLNNSKINKKIYEPSKLGKLLRNYIFRITRISHSMPYVKVIEKKLRADGFFYEESLLEGLKKCSVCEK